MRKLLMIMILVGGTYTFISFNNETLTIKNSNLYKNGKFVYVDDLKIDKIEEKPLPVEEVKNEEPKVEVAISNQSVEKVEVKEEAKPVVEDPIVVNAQPTVIETLIGKMTGYGPDCYGCTSGRTATGYDIVNNGVYYNDSVYGKVRIVSGDKSYKFGTIVRIVNYGFGTEPILAIMLDTGGGVGKGEGKHAVFDLLFQTEREAEETVGTKYNVKFEILRLGW